MRGPRVLVEGVVIAYDSLGPPSLLALPHTSEETMRANILYCVV